MIAKRGRRMWTKEKIKQLRGKHGETQEQFAKRLGVGLGTLRCWEQGQGKPLGPAEKLMTLLEQQLDREPVAASA